MEPVLEARTLVKRYRRVQAVDGVSLTVSRGEFHGFLGPNGAGKTTTLRLLLGLVRPDAGEARIRGLDPRRDPRRAHQGVGFVPETLALYRTLTGRQTLRFFADLKDAPREGVDELLALVGLRDAADRRAGDYSRGMMQRLGLAQALLGDPEILILDEPTAGLDPLAHRQIKDLLRTLHRKGATILFSSHILSEVEELAERVAILRSGRLVADDTVDALRRMAALKGGVILTLASPSDHVAAAVATVSGVDGVRLDGNKLFVTCDAAARLPAAQEADLAGGGVQNIESQNRTLEDVFLALTAQSAAVT